MSDGQWNAVKKELTLDKVGISAAVETGEK